MDANLWITVYVHLVCYSSCMIQKVSGWGWGDDDDEENEITTLANEVFDNDDGEFESLGDWRRNILVVAGLVIIIGGTIALLYCCCRMFASQPEENPQTQQDPEHGDNERYPRDSFYQPPPRYSALIRSHSQRKARLDVLKKKEEDEGELPRYSAAVRQLSANEPADRNVNDDSTLVVGTEATEFGIDSTTENRIDETTPLNPEQTHDSSVSLPSVTNDMTDSSIRQQMSHAASCSDLIDSPMHNVTMRKKQRDRTNSDPPRYSTYLYSSMPKL